MKLIVALMLASVIIVIAGGSEESKEIVPASYVLAKIQNGQPVEYDHVTITGDLNLSKLILPSKYAHRNGMPLGSSESIKIVRSPIRISNSRIDGSVDFNSTILENLTYFRGTFFNHTANFNYTNFCSDADFGHSEFNRSANFYYCNFNSDADFGYSKFNSSANFYLSNFNGDADFWYSKFNSSAKFESLDFNGDASFEGSNFNKIASFQHDKFRSYADFSSSNFNSYATIYYSKFNGSASFQHTCFNSDANFGYSKFFNDADFSYAKFKGDAFFYDTNFMKDIDLKQTEYDKLYLRWNSNCNLAYDDTAYQLLIENLKKLGFTTDVDICYYQFRVGQFLHQNPVEDPFMSFINLGAWIFYGYGKKPLYPFLWSIFLIGLFGVFWITVSLPSPKDAIIKYNLTKSWPRRAFSLFLMLLIIVIWKVVRLKKSKRAIDEYDQIGNWPHNMSDAICFSATVFLSGTKFFVDPPVIPVLPGMSQSLIKRAFLLERVLGAFFSILFFLAIGTTVVR